MQRSKVANELIKIGYKLTCVTEFDDLIFEKTWNLGKTVLTKEIALSGESGGDKVEARKFINGEAEEVNGDRYIIQHDYDLVHITDGIMWTDDGSEFAL